VSHSNVLPEMQNAQKSMPRLKYNAVTQTELRGPTVERVSVHVSPTAVTRLYRIVRKQAFNYRSRPMSKFINAYRTNGRHSTVKAKVRKQSA